MKPTTNKILQYTYIINNFQLIFIKMYIFAKIHEKTHKPTDKNMPQVFNFLLEPPSSSLHANNIRHIQCASFPPYTIIYLNFHFPRRVKVLTSSIPDLFHLPTLLARFTSLFSSTPSMILCIRPNHLIHTLHYAPPVTTSL